MKIHDISQPIRPGMPVWPGDEPFTYNWTMRLGEGESCNLSSVTMSVHTGTHMDAPFHFDASGPDIASVPLHHCMGPVRVLQVRSSGGLGTVDLEAFEWKDVQRVILKTNSIPSGDVDFDAGFTYLTENGAQFLGQLGLLLLGTDAPSVDAFDSKTLRAHHILLRHKVVLLEGLHLTGVEPGDYELIALPLRFSGLDGSPVRAILLEREQP